MMGTNSAGNHTVSMSKAGLLRITPITPNIK